MRQGIVVGIVLVLIAPGLAAASHGGASHWYSSSTGQGPDREPSSATYDVAAFMHQTSPGQTPKVYFNSEMVWSTGTGLDAQPNLAGGRVGTPLMLYHYAKLGVWKDCNGDGYIGSALLADDIYLKAADGGATCTGPHEGVDGLFAKEFRWIGPGGPSIPPAVPDAREVTDNTARVWGDFGTPEANLPGNTMPLFPFKRDTLRNTHGHLRYVDDLTWGAVSSMWTTVTGGGNIYAAVPNVNNPVTWAVKETYNDANTDAGPSTPLVGLCGGLTVAPPSYTLTGENAGGSVYPTLKEVYDWSLGGCSGVAPPGHPSLEADNPAGVVPTKVRPNQAFGFSGPVDQLPPGMGPSNTNLFIPPWQDSPGWFGHSLFILLRESRLAPDFRKATLAESTYFTAYAYVDPTHPAITGKLPVGPAVNYGRTQCPVLGPFVSPGGWDCDVNNWIAARNTLSAFWQSYSIIIDQPYQLRDTDCMDGKLTDGRIGEERGPTVAAALGNTAYPTNGAPTTGDVVQAVAPGAPYARCV